MSQPAYKNDKPRFSQIPPRALWSVAELLTQGQKKHGGAQTWQRLDDLEASREYADKAQRHQWQRLAGEVFDPESGARHLTAAIADLLIALEVELVVAERSHRDQAYHEDVHIAGGHPDISGECPFCPTYPEDPHDR